MIQEFYNTTAEEALAVIKEQEREDKQREEEIINEVRKYLERKGEKVQFFGKENDDWYCHYDEKMLVGKIPYLLEVTQRYSDFDRFDDEFMGESKYKYFKQVLKNCPKLRIAFIVKYDDMLVYYNFKKIVVSSTEERTNGSIVRFEKSEYKILKRYLNYEENYEERVY